MWQFSPGLAPVYPVFSDPYLPPPSSPTEWTAHGLTSPLVGAQIPKSVMPLIEVEQDAVKSALAFEAAGQAWIPNPQIPADTYKTHYAKAVTSWTKARQAASGIAFATAAEPPPTSDNAALRAMAYESRRDFDSEIATGKRIRPSPSFAWPRILQNSVPGTNPPAADPNAPGEGGGPTTNQVADFAGGVGFTALILGIGYLAWTLIAKRPLP